MDLPISHPDRFRRILPYSAAENGIRVHARSQIASTRRAVELGDGQEHRSAVQFAIKLRHD
jgi:hypothetical protein